MLIFLIWTGIQLFVFGRLHGEIHRVEREVAAKRRQDEKNGLPTWRNVGAARDMAASPPNFPGEELVPPT